MPISSWESPSGRYNLVESSTVVNRLARHENLIWGLAQAGLVVWDTQAGLSRLYTFLDDFLPDLNYYAQGKIVPAPDGDLWLFGREGLVHYIFAQHRFETIPLPESIYPEDSLAVDIDGRVHFIIAAGEEHDQFNLVTYDPLARSWQTGQKADLRLYAANNLVVAPDGDLWSIVSGAFLGEELLRYHPRTASGERIALPEEGDFHGAFNCLAAASDGSIWVGTTRFNFEGAVSLGDGLGRYDPASQKWSKRTPPDWPEGLVVNAALSAPDGSLWFGTRQGASRYDPAADNWRHFTAGDGLGGAGVNDILLGEDNTLWFATDKGLTRLETETQVWQTYPLSGLGPGDFSHIQAAPDGSLWFSARSETFQHYHPDTRQVETYPIDKTDLWGWVNSDLALAPDGSLWAGFAIYPGFGNFARLDPKTGQWIWLKDMEYMDQMLRMHLAFSSDGALWINAQRQASGTLSFDLLRYLPAGDGWKAEILDLGADKSYITVLQVDPSGILWLLAQDQLVRFDPAQNARQAHNLPAALTNKDITSLAIAPDGSIWLMTHLGLVRFDPIQTAWTVYSQTDTPFAERISSFDIAPDGTLWFGQRGSLFHFSPVEPAAIQVTAPAFVCPQAPPIRLSLGAPARVAISDGIPLNIRSQPQIADNVIATLPEGAEIEIIGGPQCFPRPTQNDALVFWQIRAPSTGVSGWAAEGDAAGYFIELLP